MADERWRIEIRGRVQGVGFRPFIYRVASELGLAGHVGNDAVGAFIEAQGSARSLAHFIDVVWRDLPPLANIEQLTRTRMAIVDGVVGFAIVASREAGGPRQLEVTPDAATCGDCERELCDPADRRYRYPFINCTNCGPRYSIITDVPYDRPQTTMAAFVMCRRCQHEYEDPVQRRYHAQPNACPACGPQLFFAVGSPDDEIAAANPLTGEAALARAREMLLAGQIVAVKGLGGFHLACRADSEPAVARLRERKRREAKPLAVMVRDVALARTLVVLTATAEAELCHVSRPIVLAPRRPHVSGVASGVAPQTDLLGVMLPYTPLHTLLCEPPLPPLVMTSGNPSAEPLSADNGDARARLAHIADGFLLHDRAIERPIDDSVVMVAGNGPALMVRRARGFVPCAIPFRRSRAAGRGEPEPILALGGDLKSTVCFASGDRAVLSEHLGDLENAVAFRNFVAAIERLQKLLSVRPRRIACDLHPGYHSTRHARMLSLPRIAVQHHHAHAVSCMVENGLDGPVIAICCDGTGYGRDGAIWGGEVLVCHAAEFTRVGQLRYVPLVGGDSAALDCFRPAAGQLFASFGESWCDVLTALRPGAIPDDLLQVTAVRLASGRTLPRTSSLGRLFDAAAFLIGSGDSNRFEAQAAIALEAAAHQAPPNGDALDWELDRQDGRWQLDTRPLIRDLCRRVEGMSDPPHEHRQALARAFHQALADGLFAIAEAVSKDHALDQVVLSGGCFFNRLLSTLLIERLEHAGLRVYRHRRVPPGDGGLSLGQARVAAQQIDGS